jgi:hypothetical protein
MIVVTISSGTFSSLTGILMNGDINMFFYSIVGFSLLLTICSYLILKEMSEDGKKEIRESFNKSKMLVICLYFSIKIEDFIKLILESILYCKWFSSMKN